MSKANSELESFLLRYIRRLPGKRSAISVRALSGQAAAFFSCSFSEKEIRATVHSLRIKGFPICSCSQGFYWPEDLADVLETAMTKFEIPGRCELFVASRMKESGRRLFGQQIPLVENDPDADSTGTERV